MGNRLAGILEDGEEIGNGVAVRKKTAGAKDGDAATDATEAVAPTPDAAPKSDPEPVVTE